MLPRKPRKPRKPKHEPEVAAAKKPPKPRAKPGAVMGRPSSYSESLATRICSELAGGKSLNAVCKMDGMPCKATVFEWIRTKPEFKILYEKAKQESADAIIEEILDIADDSSGDYFVDEEGKTRFNAEHVQRSRLRIDTRKWIAGKMRPKKYGDSVDVNHGVQDPLAALIASVQGTSFRPVPAPAIEHQDDDNNQDDQHQGRRNRKS